MYRGHRGHPALPNMVGRSFPISEFLSIINDYAPGNEDTKKRGVAAMSTQGDPSEGRVS